VLLDARGAAAGAAGHGTVHHDHTPLHLAFSCFVVDPTGLVLVDRREALGADWPCVWSAVTGGHPRPGETLRAAVDRHVRTVFGLAPQRITLAVPDFVHRTEVRPGLVEHEVCPLLVVHVSAADDARQRYEWLRWDELLSLAAAAAPTLSPATRSQIARLAAECGSPHDLSRRDVTTDGLLDRTDWVGQVPARDALDEIAQVRHLVEARLDEFLSARRHDVPEADDAVAALHAAISSLTAAGGKRLRPAFVVYGCIAAGGRADGAVLDAAAATELLHTFALLHDDVMDRSPTRRGMPTAHITFRDACDPARPEAVWFGISAAVLAGNLAFVWADQLFDRLDSCVDRERVRRARALFTVLRTEVIAGQYLDLVSGAAEADAMRVALLKSARYTVTRPLQIGAALAGAGERLHRLLVDYGDATGLAFQLRDDVLGLFGDPGVTGKSCVDDLRAGKRTLLVTRALALTSAAGRHTLLAALGDDQLDDEAAERCRTVVAESGAWAAVETSIAVQLERALAACREIGGDAADPLAALALHAATRDR
jgi:geranylgeranyl diphosphate synthase type I